MIIAKEYSVLFLSKTGKKKKTLEILLRQTDRLDKTESARLSTSFADGALIFYKTSSIIKRKQYNFLK